jgi:hypothetical protein
VCQSGFLKVINEILAAPSSLIREAEFGTASLARFRQAIFCRFARKTLYEATPEASIAQQPGDRRKFNFSRSLSTRNFQHLASKDLDAWRRLWGFLI